MDTLQIEKPNGIAEENVRLNPVQDQVSIDVDVLPSEIKNKPLQIHWQDFCQNFSKKLNFNNIFKNNEIKTIWVRNIVLVIGFLVYIILASIHDHRSQEFKILITGTVLLGVILVGFKFGPKFRSWCCVPLPVKCFVIWWKKQAYIPWVILAVNYASFAAFLIIDTWLYRNDWNNLVSLAGLVVCVVFGLVFSKSRLQINWQLVLWGIVVQLWLAAIILRSAYGYHVFKWLGDTAAHFLSHTQTACELLFGPSYRDHFFVFAVLPVTVFFSSVIAVLYYLGWMQMLVRCIGWLLRSSIGVTTAEALCSAANIFVGQIEAAFTIQPLVPHMTASELHTVMTSGFASISGSVMAAYIMFGVAANHLITASVLSAPAALVIAKILYPETEPINIATQEDVHKIKPRKEHNIIEAAAAGATSSVKLVASIAANVIAFLSLLSFFNYLLTWFGARVGFVEPPVTFELLCSYVFYPLAIVLGASIQDCSKVAQLIGVKIFTNEFVAYQRLGVLINNRDILDSHMGLNGSFLTMNNSDVILYDYVDSSGVVQNSTMLEGGIISSRSEVICTYALCGFANIGAMGIMLGGLGSMAQQRKGVVSGLVVRALVAGNLACFMTAAVAGLFFEG